MSEAPRTKLKLRPHLLPAHVDMFAILAGKRMYGDLGSRQVDALWELSARPRITRQKIPRNPGARNRGSAGFIAVLGRSLFCGLGPERPFS